MQRRNTAGRPILLKIAPDLEWDAIEEILALCEEHKLAGIIADEYDDRSFQRAGIGAAAGRVERAAFASAFDGSGAIIASRTTLPVIAVGGIFSPMTRWRNSMRGRR